MLTFAVNLCAPPLYHALHILTVAISTTLWSALACAVEEVVLAICVLGLQLRE